MVVVVGAAAAFLAATSTANAYIYWSDYGPGTGGTGTTIGRANLNAAGKKSAFIDTDGNPQYNPAAIVSDGTHVYWASSSSTGYAIGRANTDGTSANPTFLSGAQVGGGAFGLAVTSSNIYWTDGSRYIGRAAINGTGANPHFIDMGSGHATFGIAISQNTLYVGEFARVVSVPNAQTNTPSVTTFANLAGGSAIPTSLSIADGYVYWAELNLGVASSIARKGLNGSGFDENYVPNLTYPTGVANDGAWVYWVDHGAGTIGRALDNDANATDIQPSFVTDETGPWGVAVDSLIDTTTTSVSCTPSTVASNDPSVCTAAVADSASSETPTGTVSLSGGASTFFPGGNTCTLGPKPGGGGSTCTVGAESAGTGQQTVTGSYLGDATHLPSSGSGHYCVGDATVCGGGTGGGGGGSGGGGSGPGAGPGGGSGPGGSHAVCKVPKLKGKTLAQARKLLTKAHCKLGKLKRPRMHKGRHPALVVGKQSPAAGRSIPSGAKVALRLVPKPRGRRR